MLEDIRYGFRQLRKHPGFAIVAVTTLALGIGAAAAMFGLIQGVLLTPPPYERPDRLVLVSTARTDGQPYDRGSTVGQWIGWRTAGTLQNAGLYRWTFNYLVRPDGSESMGGMVVTRDYLRTLGLRPMIGRVPTDEEAGRPDAAPAALMIGYEMWQRRFNGDPEITSQTIRISRFEAPLPVVGVMPPDVRFLPDPGAASEPNYDVNATVDFWLVGIPDENRPDDDGWNIVGRLRDDAALPEVRAELAGMMGGLAVADPDLAGLTAEVQPLQDVLNADGRRLLLPLVGAVALVFLIACANVGGLLLARGLQRQSEYAMRSALGAGRRRLFRQVLTESLALATIAAVAGAALAVATVRIFTGIGGEAIPRADTVAVGWPVLAFGCLAALVSAAVAALLPAVRAARPGSFGRLKGSRSTISLPERRLLGAVATVQIVLTVALLSGAALLIRTGYNLTAVRPGYETENILAMTVTAVQRGQWQQFHTQALERVSALPGVTHAAFAWGLPLTGNKWPGEIEIPGQGGSSKLADRITVPVRSVTPDYFAALSIRLVEGRAFRQTDDGEARRVAIVNTAFARRYFGGRAMGRAFTFPGNQKRPVQIVGIIADTRTELLNEGASPELYVPFWQNGAFSKHLVVRAAGDPVLLVDAVRRELRAVDSTSAIEHVTTMAEIRRASVAKQTFAMQLLVGFAIVATLLAIVGLYGVLSISVGSRAKELAVRQAVGAQWSHVVRLVLGEGARLVVAGVGLGLVAALLLGRVLETLLFDVRPADPLALAAAAVLFALIALLACWLPARRAGRLNLMEALRQDS